MSSKTTQEWNLVGDKRQLHIVAKGFTVPAWLMVRLNSLVQAEGTPAKEGENNE